MAVEIKVPFLLQRMVGGVKTVKADGNTISQVLDNLDKNYPGFKGRLITSEGKLHPFVNLYLNEEDIRFLKELNTEVSDGDVLSILPAVAGGCICGCICR